MGGGGGGGANVVNENPLPDWMVPPDGNYAQNYLDRARAVKEEGYTPYQTPTYAVRNQNEIDGITALAARATNGSATVNLGITLLTATLKGEHLTGYPSKDAEWAVRADEAYDDFIYSTLPEIATRANNVGGFGGSGHEKMKIRAARTLFNALANLAYEIYGADYFSERKYMSDAIVNAVDYAENSVGDIDALRMAGLYEREYQQGILEDAYRLWIDEYDAKIRQLNVMGNAIRALVGSDVKKTTPYYRPGKMAEIAGIALAGMGMVAQIYDARRSAGKKAAATPAVAPPEAPGDQ
jgi:hypothetical protein